MSVSSLLTPNIHWYIGKKRFNVETDHYLIYLDPALLYKANEMSL